MKEQNFQFFKVYCDFRRQNEIKINENEDGWNNRIFCFDDKSTSLLVFIYMTNKMQFI